jgi:hypothetical protein
MNTHSGQLAISSIRLVGGAAGGAISCSPSSPSMVNLSGLLASITHHQLQPQLWA